MSTLAAILRKRIAESGPMPLDAYMEAALLDPEHGYYTTQTPFGREGDFITAPEISQIFGELIGLWLADTWEKLGRPACALTELGPGRGTLMKDILRATRTIPGFHQAISVCMVEASPKLIEMQRDALQGAHPRIAWQETLTPLPQLPLLLIANEWFDALPIRQFLYNNKQWHERRVEGHPAHPEQFRFTCHPAIRRDDIVEISEPAHTAMQAIATHIANHKGAALIADYGYTHGHGDTLQAVKSHRFHDPLTAPGTADITAHVDFAALAHAAAVAEIYVHGPVPQGQWLLHLGADIRAKKLQQANPAQAQAIHSSLRRLTSPDEMGTLFKILAVSSLSNVEGF